MSLWSSSLSPVEAINYYYYSSHHPKGIKLFLSQESSFQQLVSFAKLVGKALTKRAEAHGPGEEAVPEQPEEYQDYQQQYNCKRNMY